jgi:hypothetical protein
LRKPEIKTGDRYIKVDAPNIIWVVDQLLNEFDTVPHVYLRWSQKIGQGAKVYSTM